MNEILGQLSEMNPHALTADGFEDALIGYTVSITSSGDTGPLAVYDSDKCIAILMHRDKMSYEDALEFLEFNTFNAYVGPQGRIFVKIS